MSETQTGVVQAATTKSGKNFTNFRFKIDNEWYGIFKDAENGPVLESIGAGDVVEFTWHAKGNFKNLDAITIAQKATPEQRKKVEAGTDAVGSRIFYSGVQKPAVELTIALLHKDMVPLSKTKNKQVDSVLEFVRNITEELANQVNDFTDNAISEKEEEKELQE